MLSNFQDHHNSLWSPVVLLSLRWYYRCRWRRNLRLIWRRARRPTPFVLYTAACQRHETGYQQQDKNQRIFLEMNSAFHVKSSISPLYAKKASRAFGRRIFVGTNIAELLIVVWSFHTTLIGGDTGETTRTKRYLVDSRTVMLKRVGPSSPAITL